VRAGLGKAEAALVSEAKRSERVYVGSHVNALIRQRQTAEAAAIDLLGDKFTVAAPLKAPGEPAVNRGPTRCSPIVEGKARCAADTGEARADRAKGSPEFFREAAGCLPQYSKWKSAVFITVPTRTVPRLIVAGSVLA